MFQKKIEILVRAKLCPRDAHNRPQERIGLYIGICPMSWSVNTVRPWPYFVR